MKEMNKMESAALRCAVKRLFKHGRESALNYLIRWEAKMNRDNIEVVDLSKVLYEFEKFEGVTLN